MNLENAKKRLRGMKMNKVKLMGVLIAATFMANASLASIPTNITNATNEITVKQPFWEGNVTLIRNSTFEVVAHNSGETYRISSTTALGALDEASRKGNFSYTINDEWWDQYESLLVDSIAGKWNEGMKGWLYWVNYPEESLPAVGADKYQVEEGDKVDWFYGEFGVTPDTTSMLIRIHVHIAEDNEPPIIEIKKPTGGIYISDKEILPLPIDFAIIFRKITVEVSAMDELTRVEKVEFYVDDILRETDENPPYKWKWEEKAIGFRVLKAIAYDEVGNYDSAERTVLMIP